MSAVDPKKKTLSAEQLAMLGSLLDRAIPLAPVSGNYITREEFETALETIESKIENSNLRSRNWVLLGCLIVITTFGGGYVSLVSKIDRLNEQLPVLAQIQEQRAPWIQRQERRDQMQDEALRELDKSYQPLPYSEPPQ